MSVSANELVETATEHDTARIVDATIQRCSPIATLPAVTVEIVRLSDDPNASGDDLTKVIVNDPALGVRILKLVNSAYYGMTGQISSVKRAVSLLGVKALKNVAIAASLVKLFRGGVLGATFNAADLWTHSTAVATGAQLLARRTGLVAADEAFLAGLIHDAGILVEMQACGPYFGHVIQRLATDENLTFRLAEREVLGASHEDFGAGLCKAWNFPTSLQTVTGYHHRPWDLAEADRLLPTLIHVADVLAARSGLGYTRTVESDLVAPLLLGALNLTEPDLDAVVEELPAALQQADMPLSD